VSETVEKLLDAAEGKIRLKGFHAFSFRDLANETGIKSSSVHYHFPQKQDLGLALVRRYSEEFFEALEEESANAKSQDEKLEAFFRVYKHALISSGKHCLCGMLGAETNGIPEALGDAVSDFFQANINWFVNALDDTMEQEAKVMKATNAVSLLQGAMMLSNNLKDHSILERTKTLILT